MKLNLKNRQQVHYSLRHSYTLAFLIHLITHPLIDQAYKLFVNFYSKTANDLVDLEVEEDAVQVLDQHNENIKKLAIEFSQLLPPNKYTAGIHSLKHSITQPFIHSLMTYS